MHLEGENNTYELVKRLGKGAFGVTYLAKGEYGNSYAIKEFTVAGSKDSRDFEANILGEILSFCKKTAVCFIETIDYDDKFFIVMDYLDGKSVGDLIFENKMPLKERQDEGYEFMKDLILGLHKLHTFGLFHQDIKADNIMYVDGTAKYIDFGVSCMASEAKDSGGRSVFGVGLNEPCGTISTNITLPPEMVGDLGLYHEPILRAHDIWSLGCVILSWYTVKDSDYKQEDHAYHQEFDNVEKFQKIFSMLEKEDPLAYQVVIGLLNRDPIQRNDNFQELVDYFSNVFAQFAPQPDFTPNWEDKSVSIAAKKELCALRKEWKKDFRLPEIFIGAKKCDRL